MRVLAWRHRLEYLAFRLVVCVVQALSPRACTLGARRLAWFMHRCLPRKWTRYAVARENLRTAFGSALSDQAVDETIYEMWLHLFRLVAEIIHIPRRVHQTNVCDMIDFVGRPDMVRAFTCGRPMILVSAHFGNWELAGVVFGIFGFPLGVVARHLDNPYLHEWFRRFRRSTGHSLIPKNGGLNELLATFAAGHTVALLGDQDAGQRGVFVNYFGRPASTNRAIALIALEHQAILCVGYARRLPGSADNPLGVRYELGQAALIDPLETRTNDPVREITQQFTTALERVVRLAPEQYFWVHRRWKSVPPTREARAKRRAG